MKVVVLMDSFKGSMSSLDAGESVKCGILRVLPEAEVIVKQIADGGEGTLDALASELNVDKHSVKVNGPLNNKVIAEYAIANNVALMEMSQAAGITLCDNLNPLHASTFGVGEMIIDALDKGVNEFIIGIGGSATNDGGMGMLKALGVKFLGVNDNELECGAIYLKDIYKIDTSNLLPKLKDVKFKIACDVDNVLCGKIGATYIYGPQKGITDDMLEEIDLGMKNYANKSIEYIGKDYSNINGTGAAGGLGFAFISYLTAELVSGVDLILDVLNIEELLKDADIVITGEGSLDGKSINGKLPIGVARLAKKHNCKVMAFAGRIGENVELVKSEGIDEYYCINDNDNPLEEMIKTENAKTNLSNKVEEIFIHRK